MERCSVRFGKDDVSRDPALTAYIVGSHCLLNGPDFHLPPW